MKESQDDFNRRDQAAHDPRKAYPIRFPARLVLPKRRQLSLSNILVLKKVAKKSIKINIFSKYQIKSFTVQKYG